MNSLQLQSLQNYFQQDKLKVLKKNLNEISFDFDNYIQSLKSIYEKGYTSFYYIGENPIEILSLIYFKLENGVELSLGSINDELNKFKLSEIDNLYIEKNGENKFFIFTSGTTGDPKKTEINLNHLLENIKVTKNENLTWLLTYNSKSFAGLQVLLTAFLSNNMLLASSTSSSINQLLKIIEKFNINAISATPTFWRMLVNTKQIKKMNLSLITLGGEIVDEQILKKLTNEFPSAKITQIYATTELGKIFTVNDNRSGFPVTYLDKYDLKISNSELFASFNNKYVSTKDYVEISDDRVNFVGRSIDFIKVAGNKVNINNIEQKIIKLPNVMDANLKTSSSIIVGNILVLDIVLEKDGVNERTELKKMLRNNLQPPEVPKLINFIDLLNTNSNLKKRK